MNRNDIDWYGYIPAITTPFTRAGDLDLTGLAGQLEWYVQQRMHGVVLAGTSGEWFSLSESERAQLFSESARVIDRRMTVIGGCNAFTAAEAIRHAHAAERAGLDGILLTPPPYMVPNANELIQFYQDVSDATDIPLCIYNWPRGCVVDMNIDLLDRLADINNVVAIKNSTPDFAAFLDGLYRLSDKVRYFNVPTTKLGADLVEMGHGDGLMGAGGVLGSDHPDFWNLLRSGDKARAIELGERDRVIMRAWFNKDFAGNFGSAQAILKTALRLRGVPAGFVRRPLLELNAAEVASVAATLTSLGIEIVNPTAQ
ncbi:MULTISPECIES: dihydrodipicolinate synthase family protein [unclassified Serratia (in: enterobacteria)]|uniref:dihydrodipicolinate synthase family protein n=1 Tax=unclassified Serratia (in: enterobacteria) TaxID=2647522 RepID=UPI00050656B4|nr:MULTISPECIES: dihydrodipicolinate synthase family protein [unclassified Serratia (in: enterobacteria)]KFK95693.1 dihydrodipicolinate synthetase [Serratia sp. Ag2]KFK95963.1 dihydrodipicolinate synthetase [Serratia sp. Ag1]